MTMRKLLTSLLCLHSLLAFAVIANADDPLPSWHDGKSKQSIVDFVRDVTATDGDHFVPPASRIAVFDNDGTLWCEQPMYVQLAFALDRVKQLAPQHPEWNTQEPFRSALANDFKGLANSGEKGLLELVMATHAGMTTTEFEEIVQNWIQDAKHPRFQRPYTECVYKPMLELLEYLKTNEFKVYIVSGGGIEFMRPWAERVYGIPREHVIGSSIKTEYQLQAGQPALVRLPAINFIDDKAGKPVAIHQFIGQQPILAVGNSDGDYEMLRYTTAGDRQSLGVLVHHTDAPREFAYDRQSAMGRLDRALDEADGYGWTVVDIQQDWREVFRSLQP